MTLVTKLRSRLLLILLSSLLLTTLLHAEEKTWRINIPKRTKPTPVQALNRDGVKAIEGHQYEKAKKLFYKAYLLDPNDPFTLNNLGYMAELDGDVERAQRFYQLSQEQNSQATVDRSSEDKDKGKTVAQVAGHAESAGVQLNVMNVEAISLLNHDRVAEADAVLQKALRLDPRNPFTLNNMGYTKEKEGELEAAVNFYRQAAAAHSEEPVIVTVNRAWRGQAISKIAGDNAKKIQSALKKESTVEARVARLNQRGVSALNRNDRADARKYFTEAFKLAPEDAFTLNNMGYVAELDGDRESADYYYAKAKDADNHERHVTLASRREDEGKKLTEVAVKNDTQAEASIQTEQEINRRHGKAPVLIERRTHRPASVEPDQDQKPDQDQNPQTDTNDQSPR
ncbi:MAG: tetratricopeptide repeat protein [Acidobacteria bacterium]|nr:tetratricopeptide repeat protein [Acidobacteriota bacterium]MBV9437675.1 tetratricopeptide repeat protein [Acidobacteriota bacterium]